MLFFPSRLRISYGGMNLFILRQYAIKCIEFRVTELLNKISQQSPGRNWCRWEAVTSLSQNKVCGHCSFPYFVNPKFVFRRNPIAGLDFASYPFAKKTKK